MPEQPDEPGSLPVGRARVEIARVYDRPPVGGARRVLVDRLWPRGVSRQDAPFDDWLKEVAPSPGLRAWYAHVPERFEEFARRYRQELERSPAREALAKLSAEAGARGVVLVTATKAVHLSAAAVLEDVLLRPGWPA